MKKQLFYILYFIGLIGFAQETPVSISADTTNIRIGEQIQFKISVNQTANVVFPELKLDSLGKIEVVEALAVDTLKEKIEKKYVLTSFDSGQYIIPQQQVIINNQQFLTDSLLVNVATVKVDTTKQKMFLIKSIKREPKTFDDYKHLWWWAIPILLLFAIILYFIFRKKKEKAIPKIYVAPIQEALQRLKELDEKQLLQQNKIKIYYSELTNIVRTYIEKDIKIPALESTTNELIETIIDFNESSKLGISKETIKQLKQVLQSADLVKFAKSKPIIDEIKSDRTIVEEILKNTQTAVHINDLKQQETIDKNNEIVIEAPIEKKSTFKKYLIIFLILIALGIGAIGYFGYKFVKNNILGKTTTEMMEEQWYKATYGFPKITMETPEILTVQSVQLPDNGVSTIGEFSIYTYGSPISNFYVAVSTTNFIKELDEMDLDVGMSGALNAMEKQLNTRFTNIKKKNINIDGVRGKKAEVEYKRLNESTQLKEDYKLTMLFFADKKGMRQVYVSSLWSDDSAESVVNRIIKSVSLKP
ncbi:hypothetical protein BX611_0815 [Lutibacter oceani]|uniref:Oxygen tolerance protein BatD n=1 Tax=Lutibacter oceani TaxID=1853311 RepID=A0A3D9S115_9FLAO|nr:hypothetical protein [Lutibacter oceani]REE83524.1 hypothetical protein BX611_0815 [Lutibacter oceani]